MKKTKTKSKEKKSSRSLKCTCTQICSRKRLRFLKQFMYLFAACSTMFVCGTYQAWTGILLSTEARHFHITENVSGFGTCVEFGLPYDPLWGSMKHYHVVKGITMERWISILIYVGSLLSPLPTAYFANRKDRKKIIIASNIPFYLSWAVIFLYRHVIVVYISRIIAGIGLGIIYTMWPLYIGDIVHESLYKYVYHIKHIMFCLGMFYSGIVSAFFTTNVMLLIHFLIPVMTFISFCLLPPSPYSLIILKREYLAELTFVEMRGFEFFDEARKLFRTERARARRKMLLMKTYSFFREVVGMFKHKTNRNVLFMSTGLAFFQQCTMFNLCIALPAQISKFVLPDIDSRIMGLCHYGTGALTSMVCMFFLHKVSRRLLLILSNTGMLLCTLYLLFFLILIEKGHIPRNGYEWTCIISFSVSSAMYSIGFSHVPDELLCGVVPHEMRAEVAGLQEEIVSICVFLVFILDSIRPLTMYLVFMGFQLIGNFFIFFFVPENKGKIPTEIWNMLQDAPKLLWMYHFTKLDKTKKELKKKESSGELDMRKKKSRTSFEDLSDKDIHNEKLRALFKKKREEYVMKQIARKRHPSGRLVSEDLSVSTKK